MRPKEPALDISTSLIVRDIFSFRRTSSDAMTVFFL